MQLQPQQLSHRSKFALVVTFAPDFVEHERKGADGSRSLLPVFNTASGEPF